MTSLSPKAVKTQRDFKHSAWKTPNGQKELGCYSTTLLFFALLKEMGYFPISMKSAPSPPGGSEGRRKAEKAEVGGAVVLCLAVPSTGGNLEVRTGNNFSSGRLGCHEWAGVQPASEPNRHTAPEFQLEWLPTTFLLQKP